MGFRYRSRPDPHSGHGTGLVLRPRDDRLFLQAPVAHLRLPKVGRAVTTGAAPKPGANRRGKCSADRVCAQPEELSPRRPGQADPGETRGATGSGVHSVGPGAVRQLPAVARQAKPQNLSQAGRWQVSSLLRLLPGRRSGALLAAGADVVSFPAAVLLQRPQLSGTTDEPAPSRVPGSGQRLRLDCRLRTSAEAGRRVWGPEAAPQTGRLRRSLLPGGEAARAYLPLESGSGGVRHRHVFRQPSDLQAIYERLTRTAIHTVKPDNVATFPGRKLNGNYQDEMGNRFNTRLEGTRIKHTMGPVSIKMYDKFQLILRIETTVVNVSFFKHYREVEHQDGTRSMAGPR